MVGRSRTLSFEKGPETAHFQGRVTGRAHGKSPLKHHLRDIFLFRSPLNQHFEALNHHLSGFCWWFWGDQTWLFWRFPKRWLVHEVEVVGCQRGLLWCQRGVLEASHVRLPRWAGGVRGEQTRKTGPLLLGDEVLPSYVGIVIVSHYKNTYNILANQHKGS